MLPRIAAQRERAQWPWAPAVAFSREITPAPLMMRAQYCEAKVVVHICGRMPLWMA